jgi:hypothetical protein
MNWKRRLLGSISLTSALFVFQACYGSPQDFGSDVLIEGQVKSKTTGNLLKGIKVSVNECHQYEYTDEKGNFSFYTGMSDTIKVVFEDIGLVQEKIYKGKDTIISNTISKIVHLDIEMEEN